MPERFFTQPLYLQLRDALAERIARGEWKPGTAIPGEGDLARELGVSKGTVRKALDLLESERLLSRRQGRGTFVIDPGSQRQRFNNFRLANGAAAEGEASTLDIVMAEANNSECTRLQLAPGDQVYRISRLRLHQGKAFMIEAASLPAVLFPQLLERTFRSHRLVEIAQAYSLLLGNSEERIFVGPCSPMAAEKLESTPGNACPDARPRNRDARWTACRMAQGGVRSERNALLRQLRLAVPSGRTNARTRSRVAQRMTPNAGKTSNASLESYVGPPRRSCVMIGLAAAVGVGYFFAARLSLALLTTPDGVAVFWPASGLAAGTMIALGLKVTVAGDTGGDCRNGRGQFDRRPKPTGSCRLRSVQRGGSCADRVADRALPGPGFNLDSLRRVLGLFLATGLATTISGVGGAMGFALFHHSPAPALTTWLNWFASDAIGVITVAPLMIGLIRSLRDLPNVPEAVEGVFMLVVFSIACAVGFGSPTDYWFTLLPFAVILPLLIWPAARCPPVFTAAALFILALVIVWTLTFDIGRFGRPRHPSPLSHVSCAN